MLDGMSTRLVNVSERKEFFISFNEMFLVFLICLVASREWLGLLDASEELMKRRILAKARRLVFHALVPIGSNFLMTQMMIVIAKVGVDDAGSPSLCKDALDLYLVGERNGNADSHYMFDDMHMRAGFVTILISLKLSLGYALLGSLDLEVGFMSLFHDENYDLATNVALNKDFMKKSFYCIQSVGIVGCHISVNGDVIQKCFSKG